MLDGPNIRRMIPSDPPQGLTPAEYEWYIQERLFKSDTVKVIDIVEFNLTWEGINNNLSQGIVMRDYIKQGYAKDNAQNNSPIVPHFQTRRRAAVEENFDTELGEQPLLVKLRNFI